MNKMPNRIPMREQPANHRRSTFEEVPLGYSEDEAMAEAKRCLQCKKPLCMQGCPVEVNIPDFVALISQGKFEEASLKIKEANSLPAICGRVCPQETQCEGRCILGKKSQPIAIGNLERFAADWQRANSIINTPAVKIKNGKQVAVIGSGPAGLTCAGDLVKNGFDVTVFEALHEAGGVLVYGIPEFRLPKEIVKKEIQYLENLGVKIEKNFIAGKTATVDDLLLNEGFDAVFIGSGAGLPSFMKIKGENSIGVYSANEFLTRSNLMKAYLPQASTPVMKAKVTVTVGGGNVAMDSARTALRLGSEKSIVVYRRTEEDMPARSAELHHAKEEGIEFHFLCNPTEIIADENGFVKAIKCIRMAQGQPDSSGRCKPVPIEGSEFEIPCDSVIIAIGNSPNPLIPSSTPDLSVSKHGTIVADESTGRTSKKFVYAGGDIVSGAATVILAMGAGKAAAKSIMEDLINN